MENNDINIEFTGPDGASIDWIFSSDESPFITFFKAQMKAQEIFLQNEEERREKALLN